MTVTPLYPSEADLHGKLAKLIAINVLTPAKVQAWLRDRGGTNKLGGLTPAKRRECAAWADALLAQHQAMRAASPPPPPIAETSPPQMENEPQETPSAASEPSPQSDIPPEPEPAVEAPQADAQNDMAARYVELLNGRPDAPTCFRTVDDDKKRGLHAHKHDGTLDECRADLRARNEAGFGVFAVVNEGGHDSASIARIRAVFIDADGSKLAEMKWHTRPHFIVQRDETHFHAYWLVSPDFPLDQFKPTQLRLAQHCGSDPKVCDLPRVMRLPGFAHMKDASNPIQVQLVEMASENIDGCMIERLSFDQVTAGLPVAQSQERDAPSQPTGEWIGLAHFKRALSLIDSTFPKDTNRWIGFAKAILYCELPVIGLTHENCIEVLDDWCSGKLWRERTGDQSFRVPTYEDHGGLDGVLRRIGEGARSKGKKTKLGSFIREARKVDRSFPASDFRERVHEASGEPEDHAAPSGVSCITLMPSQLRENLAALDAAMAAHTAAHPSTAVYRRGDYLVNITDAPALSEAETKWLARSQETRVMQTLDVPRMQQAAMRATQFVKYDGRSKDYVPTECPEKLARHYLSRLEGHGLPTLTGIVEAPTMLMDGTILQANGYHGPSGILVMLRGNFSPIPERPTRDDARAAVKQLQHLVRGFEWSPVSEAVWLAAVLTAVVRKSLRAAPLFAFSAPGPRSGKTLGASLVSIIANGYEVAKMTYAPDGAEAEKRYYSILLSGDPIILLDNVSEPITGDALCSILTEPAWGSRRLGSSDADATQKVPTCTTWLVSGNNLTVERDMSDRTLLAYIMPSVAEPEKRRFDFDARREAAQDRAALLTAALTIMRAYQAAGAPDEALEAWGGFEDWDILVRRALVWAHPAGRDADPVLSRTMVKHGDADADLFGRLLINWAGVFGDRGKKLKEVIASVTASTTGEDEAARIARNDLADVLREITAGRDPLSIDAKKVGNWLRVRVNRAQGGLRLRYKSDLSNGSTWWIEAVI